jgi:hypothetical protein
MFLLYIYKFNDLTLNTSVQINNICEKVCLNFKYRLGYLFWSKIWVVFVYSTRSMVNDGDGGGNSQFTVKIKF